MGLLEFSMDPELVEGSKNQVISLLSHYLSYLLYYYIVFPLNLQISHLLSCYGLFLSSYFPSVNF